MRSDVGDCRLEATVDALERPLEVLDLLVLLLAVALEVGDLCWSERSASAMANHCPTYLDLQLSYLGDQILPATIALSALFLRFGLFGSKRR